MSLDLGGKFAHAAGRRQRRCSGVPFPLSLAREPKASPTPAIYGAPATCQTLYGHHTLIPHNIWKKLAVLRVTKAKNILSRCTVQLRPSKLLCWKLKLWYSGVGKHRLTVAWALPRGFISLSQWCVYYLEGGL